ncbi:glycosyltransferase family A protein [Litoribaculum gwangyangense]|uniref:Glycosyltransferase family 2 protein n=1 Tax=Litoribaculum gwangyangense TaxID=1130722 RepID=A0ABP9CQ82_9FLAO
MVPFISVVIPLYNKEKYIKATIESVLNQSFTDFEIIVVNDGSTDDSLNIVKNIKDSRIHTYSNKNHGLSYSRNFGIKKARSEYIAFLDADDLWMVDFLETIQRLIDTHKTYFVFSTNVLVLKPHKTARLNPKIFDTGKTKIIDSYFNLNKNIMCPSSLVLNKSVFKDVGYFDETVNYGEEYDFYIRCFSVYNLVYYMDSKVCYRTGLPDQLTTRNKNFIRKIPDYEKYLKTIEYPYLKKFLDFVHYELVVLYKMEKNDALVNFYKEKINTKNLTWVQKIKYFLPTDLFFITKNIYLGFRKYLSIFQ